MWLPYRLALALVGLMALLVLIALAWGDGTCAPEPGNDYQFTTVHERD